MLTLKEALARIETESIAGRDAAMGMHVYCEITGDGRVYALKEVKKDDFGGVVFVIQQL